MYVFLLWTAAGRQRIAWSEVEPYRQAMLATSRNQRERDIVNHHFDLAVEKVARDIHPLRLMLRLRFWK